MATKPRDLQKSSNNIKAALKVITTNIISLKKSMSNITKVTLNAIYNHEQWPLTTSINQNMNLKDGGDDADCDGSVKSKQQVVRRLAITVTGVHSLLTDHPHNPPLLRTPFVSCLLKIVVLQFFIGL